MGRSYVQSRDGTFLQGEKSTGMQTVCPLAPPHKVARDGTLLMPARDMDLI